jgi:hypothetical protein
MCESEDPCVHFACPDGCGAEVHITWDDYNPCVVYGCAHHIPKH